MVGSVVNQKRSPTPGAAATRYPLALPMESPAQGYESFRFSAKSSCQLLFLKPSSTWAPLGHIQGPGL